MTATVNYIPLAISMKSHVNGQEWVVTVNNNLTVTKPDGMSEAEAMILLACFSSSMAGRHCPVMTEVLDRWAPEWGKPMTLPYVVEKDERK